MKESEKKGGKRVLQTFLVDGIRYSYELIFCGKYCRGCPHGPYWYAYYRTPRGKFTRYIGKRLRMISKADFPVDVIVDTTPEN